MGTSAERERGRNAEIDDGDEAVRTATRLLPAWLTERMMTDEWLFGLLLVTGHVVAIQRITGVTQDASGAVWLDVRLAGDPGSARLSASGIALPVIVAPTDRTDASINAATVALALDLMTS